MEEREGRERTAETLKMNPLIRDRPKESRNTPNNHE